MSMTQHLMSTRPSSKTAKRPTGPAPMMTASVSIAPVSSPSDTPSSRAMPLLFSLELLGRHAQRQAIEFGCHLDLAGQPAFLAHIEGEIEHVLFHLGRGTGFTGPGGVDIDMTGCTGARAAAFGFDAGYVIELGRLHHRHSGLGIDSLAFAIRLDERDLD